MSNLTKYFPILLLTFVNIIGFTILIPVLPQVAEQYLPAHLAPVGFGVLLSSYAFFQFLASPILGALSDKYGRKPILLISQLGTTLSWVLFGAAYFLPTVSVVGVAAPLVVIALSRVIDGITGGNISVAQAWIADKAAPAERAQAYGLLGATFGFGFMFGPALGGLSSATEWGYLGTCLVALVISGVTLLVVKFVLPESLPASKRDDKLEINWREVNVLAQWRGFADNIFLNKLLITRLVYTLVFAGYTTTIVLFTREAFGLNPTALGLMLTMVGAFSIFNQAVIAPRLTVVLGELKAFYSGIALLIFALLTLPLQPTGPIIPVNSVSTVLLGIHFFVLNLGLSIANVTFKSLITNQVDERNQGRINGLDESLIALGNGVVPLFAGAVYTATQAATFWLYGLALSLPILQLIWTKLNHSAVHRT